MNQDITFEKVSGECCMILKVRQNTRNPAQRFLTDKTSVEELEDK